MKTMDDTVTSNKLLFLLVFTIISSLGTIKLTFCKELPHSGCIEAERKALLSFKEGLKDPFGQLSSWIGDDCCQWRGVECNNVTRQVVKVNLQNPYQLQNRDADEEDDVVAYKSCIGGKIDPSLLRLKHLNYLDLSWNNFDGIPIPEFIGSLNTLTYLDLSHASFAGKVPVQLGNLSALHYLNLYSYSYSNFDLILYVDNLHWLSGLTSLEYLNMGHVDLGYAMADWVQAVSMLPSLSELHLSNCKLDNLPLTASSVNFTSLMVLDLSGNNFNSSIPQWLFSSKLVKLDLSYNYFQGHIPDAFANATSLQGLFLTENSGIEGQIPRTFGKLCKLKSLELSFTSIGGGISDFVDYLSLCTKNSLEMLDLGYNRLTGYLPESLGSLERLRFLQLSFNSFCGSIPASISSLSSLKEFYISANHMNGTIPESIGQLSKLVELCLDRNSWVGVLTDAHFSNLMRLKLLDINLESSKNSIVFNVTNDWIPPFRLERIYLANFNVGPTFPAWLQTQKELKELKLKNVGISDTIPNLMWELSSQIYALDLSHNQIKGRVPKSLSFGYQAVVCLDSNRLEGDLPLWSNVDTLKLDDNLFSGHIPLEIGNIMWPTLIELHLSKNSLSGTIPSSISGLQNLTVLALSNNHLSGEIPHFWKDLPYLEYIDLSHNNLSGNIPSSMGYLLQLQMLRLSDNDLYGELPTALSKCTELRSLDLGKNRLSGNIPSWAGDKLSHLIILSLRSNFFTGTIPPQLCHISNIHILDLGHNNLSGLIPSCLGNLNGMIGPEAYNNSWLEHMELFMKGRELEYDETLHFVRIIDLSRNSLSGEIPKELTNLSLLGTLNLSMNFLTGEIPRKIGSLKLLETLDLSRNLLTGMIPSSISSLTFLNHLNLSHNNLCGRIPSGNQLQTLNDSSIYEGNSELCGPPLTMVCPNDETVHAPSLAHGENQDGAESEDLWFYMAMGLGFAIGFLVVCGILILKRSWRHAYFQFFDDMKEYILMIAIVKVNRLRRKMDL